jgi:K+-sensing histidine kinase KdpD
MQMAGQTSENRGQVETNGSARAYGVALLSVALALGITLLLLPWLSPTTTMLFFVAVMVSAWYGGWWPGLVATALSMLAINYFFVQPFYSLHVLDLETVVQLSTFLIAAGLISYLNQSRHRALRSARSHLQALQNAMSREQAALVEAQTAKEQAEMVLASINDGFYVLDRDGGTVAGSTTEAKYLGAVS